MFEELDVSCESSAIDFIRDQLLLLGETVQRISTEGKVSKSVAQNLIANYSVDFGQNYPVASFTESPTGTNVNVAMEGIVSTMGRKVVELVKMAADLLKRLFKWIIDLISFRKLRERKAKIAAMNTVVVGHATAELASKDIAPVIDPVAERALERFHESCNELVVDMLQDGKRLAMVRECQAALGTAELILTEKLNWLERNLKSGLPNTEWSEVDFVEGSDGLKYGMHSSRLTNILSKYGIASPKSDVSMLTAAQLAVSIITKDILSPAENPPNPQIVMEVLESNRNGIMEPIVMIPDATIKSIDRIAKRTHDISRMTITNTTANSVRVVDAVIKSIMDDAKSVQLIFSAANSCSAARDKFIESIWTYVTVVFQNTYNANLKSDDHEARKSVAETANRMKAKLKR